jgi:TRAP-type C4-dicarboxylate transport system permease small subunit
MRFFEKAAYAAARWLNWISAAAIIAIMVIVCINVIGRSMFGMPFKGTVDVVSLLGALAIGGSIAHTQKIKGHIRISLFVERLPQWIQSIIAALVYLLSLAIFGLITWQSILFVRQNQEVGELSEVLKIPIAPFAALVSLGCMALTLILLIDFVYAVTNRGLKNES